MNQGPVHSHLQFGTVTADPPVFLAPMAGYTDPVFRAICREYGAGAVVSELASAEGFVRGSGGTARILETFGEVHPAAAQMFGAEAHSVARAAAEVERSGAFDWIDLNCGCPARKIAGQGAGAGLLRDVAGLRRYVETVRASVRGTLSVKTRIGYCEQDDPAAVACAAEEGGADLLIVHGRPATKRHAGPVHLDRIAKMKAAVRIPVVGNGGIAGREDAERMIRETGVDGVMIGQAAIGRPWIFRELLPNREPPVSTGERCAVIERHLRGLRDLYVRSGLDRDRAERKACSAGRAHLAGYLRGIRGRRELMRRIQGVRRVGEMLEEVRRTVD
ncbi:tRNA dihydrouridine synthase [Kiritimatiella glycovorans]|uniref:tRNA-dihydrouridine synthase n=1 Tax=Kiritimatiella glycovorans TaxID=1307763 RepID=A0A0G3EL76_9BACT|nr:tRNA-dihydrouridine synthase family protein [Kiritimatiella glycovorans]AKJ64884.1 putative tRNA-dihydrouridine synthase [Kiritimatiella glycovorans]